MSHLRKSTLLNPVASTGGPGSQNYSFRSAYRPRFHFKVPFTACRSRGFPKATKGDDGPEPVLENATLETLKGADLIPDNTSWDPEGILGPSKLGGHFARRKEGGGVAQASSLLTSVQSGQPKNDLLRVRPPSSKEQIMSAPDLGIGDLIEEAFLETFWGQRAAPRILDSFRRLRAGQEFVQLWPGKGLQRAESYVEGLTATPFPDPYSGTYPWLEEVEKQASVFIEEFKQVASDDTYLKEKGTNVWVPAARKEAVAYGPSWRTLVLQDRGIWDPINSILFPKTKQTLINLDGKDGLKALFFTIV